MFLRLVALVIAATLCDAAVPVPQLPAAMSVARPTPTRAVPVADGAALQAALDAAVDGDEILLTPGVLYTRPGVFAFSMRRRGTSGWVIIRTNVASTMGDRAPRNLNLARIQHSGVSAEFGATLACRQEGSPADYWMGYRWELVEFVGWNGQRRIVSLFSERTVPTNPLPAGFVFDRVWIRPNSPSDENSFGISMAVNNFALINSIVEDIHAGSGLNQESKCFGTFETAGPVLIDNNLLQCASIGILTGGADPQNPAWIPSDFTITRNHMFKPMSWMGGPWFTIKNHLELKSGRRFLVEGNIMENVWIDSGRPDVQSGYAIVLWSVGNPSQSAHLTIRNNIITNSIRAFSMAVAVGGGALDMTDVLVENMLAEEGAGTVGDANARPFQIQGGVNNVVVRTSSFLMQPQESCMFFNPMASGPGGKTFEGDRIVCGPNTLGVGGKPLTNTYETITFTNSFADDGTGTCTTKYAPGFTCGLTGPPPGVGADMAMINLATGNRAGVTSGVWSTLPPTTTSTGPGATTPPAGTAPPRCPNGQRVCCILGAEPLPPGFIKFTLVLNSAFADFDCVDFRRIICSEMQIPQTEIVLLSSTSGSVIIEAGAANSSFTTFSNVVARGASALPVKTLTAAGGTPVVPPPSSGLPGWAIAVIVVSVLAAAAAVVLVVILVRRRKTGGSQSAPPYVAMR